VRSCGLLVPVERIATPVAFVTSLAISLDDRSNIICLDSRNLVFPDDISITTRRTSPALLNSQPKVPT